MKEMYFIGLNQLIRNSSIPTGHSEPFQVVTILDKTILETLTRYRNCLDSRQDEENVTVISMSKLIFFTNQL